MRSFLEMVSALSVQALNPFFVVLCLVCLVCLLQLVVLWWVLCRWLQQRRGRGKWSFVALAGWCNQSRPQAPTQCWMWLGTPVNKHSEIMGNRFRLLINLHNTLRCCSGYLENQAPPIISKCSSMYAERLRCKSLSNLWKKTAVTKNSSGHAGFF